MPQAKQPSFLDDSSQKQGPVECLGMTFENDDARRAYFTEKLREKLQDPAFRQIEGFPLGEDEDILRLSDPPYHTTDIVFGLIHPTISRFKFIKHLPGGHFKGGSVNRDIIVIGNECSCWG